MQVKHKQISPVNFRVGNVLSGSDEEQYEVVDIGMTGITELRKLEPDERNKPEFTQGKVTF